MVERLRLRRYREVRLGMAPRTWPRIPEMVFDERLIYEIWDDEGWRGWIPYGSPAPGRQWEVWEYNDRPPAAVDVYPDMGTAEHPYTGDRACWIWEVGAARRHSASRQNQASRSVGSTTGSKALDCQLTSLWSP